MVPEIGYAMDEQTDGQTDGQTWTFWPALYQSTIWKKPFKLKTCLAYQIAYYKSITKSLYIFINQIIKQEHTCCRQLPLFTYTLNFCDT